MCLNLRDRIGPKQDTHESRLEGKVAGDQISFSTTFDAGGNTIKILYKGTLSVDQLKMTRQREGGSGQAREFTLKRAG